MKIKAPSTLKSPPARVHVSMCNGLVDKKSWEEFKATGLSWWINRSLHLFGWAIVFDVLADGTVVNCYPARTKFRGFDEAAEDRGFLTLTKHLRLQAEALEEEVVSKDS